jgi:hypothetical protein
MTRDELIARIEAGETGPEINRSVAYLAGIGTDLEREVFLEHGAAGFTSPGMIKKNKRSAEMVPSQSIYERRRFGWGGPTHHVVGEKQPINFCARYTTSIDAAVSLVGVGTYWFADGFGKAMVWGLDVNRGESRITNNPAAALVAAWLKATA